MLHTLRLEASNALALLAWSIAPRRGISSTYDLPSVTIKRRTRINRQWTTNLRTTIRSFLFHGPHVQFVVSADICFQRIIAAIASAAKRISKSPSVSVLSRKWPKAFPATH